METSTIRLLNLIAQANGNCSDYRIGKLIDVTDSAVSRWRTGNGHMGQSAIIRACKAAGQADIFRWQVEIGAEREKEADGDFYRKVRDEFHALDTHQKPTEGWYLYPFIKGLGGIVPALVLACIAMHAGKTLAGTVDSSTNSATSVYIMRT
jgi:hypothetical protein